MAGARVLVVDDDAHLRRLVHDNLVLEGMEVRTAVDIAEAEALVRTWAPDLLVLDIMLPGRSGLDFCRGLNSGGGPAVPVLFLSARSTADDKVVGLAEGAVDYLAKPFDPAELVARCHAALRTQARARAAAQGELEQFKGEVLNLLGHELRTPLSLVVGYAELLQARGETLSAQRSREFVGEIAAGSLRLARVLEDVLLLVGPDETRAPLDLRDLLDAAVAESGPEFAAADARLDYARPAGPLRLAGAPLLLRAALRHLLENAAAFSPPGGVVELTAAPQRERVRIAVRDYGPGIPPHEQAQIFERFHQVSRGLTRAHGGLGLGLAIVRRAADDHGGQILLESRVGAGSCFTLVLPLRAGAPPT